MDWEVLLKKEAFSFFHVYGSHLAEHKPNHDPK